MRIAALALVSAAALVLAGCAAEPHPTGSPKPAATPVFRTDAEALAAAEKAYRAYLIASDQVANHGGKDLSPIRDLVTEAQWRREERTYAYYTSHGIHSDGQTQLSKSKLESRGRDQKAKVRAYFCVDVKSVRILDANGSDVTSPTRPERVTLEVQFESKAPGSSRLLIDDSESWSGTGIC